jgi:hypothetical protein
LESKPTSISRGSVALDEDDVAIQPAEVLAHELAQGVDVLDLLHGEDVEVHALDPRRDLPAVLLRLAADEPTLVGAQLEPAGIVEGKRRPLLDLDVGRRRRGDVGREVKTREEIVEVERADADVHLDPRYRWRS